MCFSRRLKVPSVCDAVTLDGKLFQTRAAATKARLPRGTMRWRRYENRCWHTVQWPLASMSATWHSSFTRYWGAEPCRQWNASTPSLNSIRSRTGNQCRSRSSGVMCSYFRAEQTSHAAALITDCSLSSWFPGRPASRCHSPDVTAPATQPATVVLLATQTDECCAAGVVQRSSGTQSWRRGSTSTRRSQHKFLGRDPR